MVVEELREGGSWGGERQPRGAVSATTSLEEGLGRYQDGSADDERNQQLVLSL
jgi:hypothetical protein